MKFIYCVLLLLCPLQYGLAQPLKPPIQPYGVGDTLPATSIELLLQGAVQKATIPNREGKYILLDFWASNCGNCIASFDKMHALQQQYGEQLQVLMVNSYQADSLQKVRRLFARRKERTGRDFTLPWLLQDTVLVKYFPYEYLPQYVWIGPGGRIAAVTDAEQLTDANLQQWLAGNDIQLPVKADALRYDTNALPALANDSAGGAMVLYRSLITACQPGKGWAQGRQMNDAGLISHLYLVNSSLLALYQLAYPDIFTVPYRQIIYDSVIQTAFFKANLTGKQAYCYEYRGRAILLQQIQAELRTALEQCFNTHAVKEWRPVRCYVLTAGKGISRIVSKGGRPTTDVDSLSLKKLLCNQPVAELLAVLGPMLPLTLVDETGLQQNIDLNFPYDFNGYTPGEIQRFLLQHGLQLQETTRTLQLAVLKPMDTVNNNCSPSTTKQ